MVDTLTVVTPWFPSPAKPPQGSFVQAAVRAVAGEIGRVERGGDIDQTAYAVLSDLVAVAEAR